MKTTSISFDYKPITPCYAPMCITDAHLLNYIKMLPWIEIPVSVVGYTSPNMYPLFSHAAITVHLPHTGRIVLIKNLVPQCFHDYQFVEQNNREGVASYGEMHTVSFSVYYSPPHLYRPRTIFHIQHLPKGSFIYKLTTRKSVSLKYYWDERLLQILVLHSFSLTLNDIHITVESIYLHLDTAYFTRYDRRSYIKSQ
jgi:hypothetical protein